MEWVDVLVIVAGDPPAADSEITARTEHEEGYHASGAKIVRLSLEAEF